MKNAQFYKAVDEARFAEMPRETAIATMEKAERFADMVMRVFYGVRAKRKSASGE